MDKLDYLKQIWLYQVRDEYIAKGYIEVKKGEYGFMQDRKIYSYEELCNFAIVSETEINKFKALSVRDKIILDNIFTYKKKPKDE